MKYVTRAGWGAKPRKCSEPLPSISAIVYHYTAADADEQSDHRNCAARVRSVQSFHQNQRGWCDVAYNFLVCKHGHVFEGRGLHCKSGATGAANAFTIAVCFLGDDTAGRDDLTAAGRLALVDITRHIEHHLGRKKHNGHREYMSTSCPGNEIMQYIKSDVFKKALYADEKLTLRTWILRQRAAGVSWKRLKETWQFKRFRELGGK